MKNTSTFGSQFKAIEQSQRASKIWDVVLFLATPILMFYIVEGAFWLSKQEFFQALVK